MERIRLRISHEIQKLNRGFSDQDVARAQRISDGYITPEDRAEFRIDSQREVLGGDHPKVLQIPVPTRVEITPEIRSEIKRIANLPDGEVDKLLAEKAASDLSEWS